MVIGRVVGVHIADEVITDDLRMPRPVARLGYDDDAVIEAERIFSMKAPEDERF